MPEVRCLRSCNIPKAHLWHLHGNARTAWTTFDTITFLSVQLARVSTSEQRFFQPDPNEISVAHSTGDRHQNTVPQNVLRTRLTQCQHHWSCAAMLLESQKQSCSNLYWWSRLFLQRPVCDETHSISGAKELRFDISDYRLWP